MKIYIRYILVLIFSIITIFSYTLICKYIHRYNLSKYIYKELTVELGTLVTDDNFLKKNLSDEKSKLTTDIDLTSFQYTVGEFEIKLKIENEYFYSKLIVVDTTPPEIEVQNLSIYLDEELPKTSDFIIEINDISDYIYNDSIECEKTVGEHEVEIVVSDIYGNETVKTVILTIEEDKEGPNFSGVDPIIISIGQKADLKKNVVAIDSRFGNVEYTVDDSKVNYSKVGSYEIYYSAKDPLGNESKVTRKITIKDVTYLIDNFPTFSQYPTYPNGCESIALYNLLRYYNIQVTPENIVNRLKKGDGPYWYENKLYGGNPEIEFVGDPKDAHGYGVYQKPIIEVANYYKKGIIDYSGHSLSDVLQIVKKKIPVQVWVSIGLKNTSVCATWTYKKTGEQIKWLCNLHSVVIVGYNSTSVYVSDSYTGKIEKYSRTQFEKMYNLFGKRAIYYPS